MSGSTWFCNVATPFAVGGALDEAAFRQFLQRFVDNDIGVYLGSGGSGEGHALSLDEIRRVYEIGVEVCGGKIPIHSNAPEQHLPQAAIRHAQIAAAAGIEVIGLYGPAGWHEFSPTEEELIDFYDTVLSAVRHPVELNTNPILGYMPRVNVLADICHRYPQVVGLKMPVGVPENYLLDMQQALRRDVEIYAMAPGTMGWLLLGAKGIFGSEGNIIPRTYGRAAVLFREQRFDEFVPVYQQLRRFIRFVASWNSSNPRWLKMAMRVLKLPGGEGVPRPPYKMPGDNVLQAFKEGLANLAIPELDEYLAASG